MPRVHQVLILTSAIFLILPGCRPKDSSPLDAGRALEVRASVKLLADSIARDVTREGPNAWLRYFETSPGFFMASGGSLAFPNNDSAATFVRAFASGIRRLELTWNDVRIDPLTQRLAVMGAAFHEVMTDTAGREMQFGGYFTAVAEETPAGWRLRDAHWSIIDHKQ
jgi:hypothetical protein